jgi:hypothetical protein
MHVPSSKELLARRQGGQRGATLVLFTIMLATVLLPMVGLAIDSTVAYFAQQRLVSATDAAALAAARSLNVGQDLESQEANATRIAQKFFDANFPPGFLNSSNVPAITPTYIPPTDANGHKTQITISTSADVGLYFMSMFGHSTAGIRASAQTSRREVNVILTLDRSGSMAGVCGIMKNDAKSFVNMFVNGRDALGLVTFMGSANTDFAWSLNFKTGAQNIPDTIDQLQCGGNTGSASALNLAWQEIQGARSARPWASNVIVFFTDGVPNGFTAGLPTPADTVKGFPLKTGTNCPGDASERIVPGFIANGGGIYITPDPPDISSTSTAYAKNGCPKGNMSQLQKAYDRIPEVDFYGNSARGYTYIADPVNALSFSGVTSDAISKNAADNQATKIRDDGITIYVIGLGSNGGVDSTFLKRVANDVTSPIFDATQPIGKYYYSPNAGQLGAAFNAIASEILRLAQ